jgi:2-oxoglutarate dehydrogenase E2 component (dihydrolipoamide succinyltransferase)
MATKIMIPQMGEAVVEATITRWLKQEGESIEAYEPLVEINTDKVDTEVPSPVTGTVLKILYPRDSVVQVNHVIAWIGEPGEEVPEDDKIEELSTPAPIQQLQEPESKRPTLSIPQKIMATPLAVRVAQSFNIDVSKVEGSGRQGQVTKEDVLAHIEYKQKPPGGVEVKEKTTANFISPVVSRLSQEHGIDLNRVVGTGKYGRITKHDILDVVAGKKKLSPAPASAKPIKLHPPEDSPAPGSLVKLNPIRRSIAQHMVKSKHTSPHVSTFMEVEMSRVIAHRGENKELFAQSNIKLTFTAYFVMATAAALRAYPMVNSSWTEDGIQLHPDVNIGMATSLGPEGLIVPVIKHADELSLMDTARSVNDLARRARDKKLQPTEVQNGTFSITNHGTSGSLFAAPIINQPQCAILSVGAIQKRPVVIEDPSGDVLAIRPLVFIGLTFDHRILDGAIADYFLGFIKQTLETWE